MDLNGDQQISLSEAFEYVAEDILQADVSSEKLEKMFKDADKDSNGFISKKEFDEAGKAIKGDGKHTLFVCAQSINFLRVSHARDEPKEAAKTNEKKKEVAAEDKPAEEGAEHKKEEKELADEKGKDE